MRILVTGVAGFIGSHLSKRLIQEGYEVVGLLRESDYAAARRSLASLHQHQDFSLIAADIRNYYQTARAIKKTSPQAVFHLAATGVNDPFLSLNSAIRSNIYGTTNLLRAGFEEKEHHKVEKFIVARTAGERTTANVYAASKASAWSFSKMFAQAYGWPIVGAMIFQAYGPGQNSKALVPSAIRAAIKNQDFPMTSGRQQRDWIYIDDVTTALCQILKSDLPNGSSIELGTGITNSVAYVVDIIFDLSGGSGKPIPGILPDRPGEEEIQIANAKETEQITGWLARISLAEGLKRCLEYERSPRT